MSADIIRLAVDLFNLSVPIGTPVSYRNDRGEALERITRSLAWVLPSGHPVVQFRGLPGCFLLDRVTVKQEYADGGGGGSDAQGGSGGEREAAEDGALLVVHGRGRQAGHGLPKTRESPPRN